MQSIIIAFIIALIISIATFLGGLLPLTKLFKKIDIRYLVGFSSGAIISIAIFDLLPEAGIKYPIAIAAGFFLIYLIEKLVLIYACGEHECEVHPTGWPALIGIATESLADGLIIAAGYVINPGLGITIAAAVLVHEIPRGFSTTIIMKAAKKTNKAAVSALAVDAFDIKRTERNFFFIFVSFVGKLKFLRFIINKTKGGSRTRLKPPH